MINLSRQTVVYRSRNGSVIWLNSREIGNQCQVFGQTEYHVQIWRDGRGASYQTWNRREVAQFIRQDHRSN